MPSRIRKRSETGGLSQPDQVMSGLKTTYSFLDEYKYYMVGGFLAIVVVLLVSSWVAGYLESRESQTAQELFDALKNADAPVGEEVTAPPGVTVFKTPEEKFGKLSESLNAFLSEHDSGAIADTARLSLAAAQMELGKNEDAVTLLSGLLEELGDTSLAPIVHENLAYAHLRLGQVDKATEHFKQMGELTTNPYLKARSLVHLGDLANPFATVAGAQKDKDGARKLYQDALELLPVPEEETADPVVTLTRQEIQLRLSMLDLG